MVAGTGWSAQRTLPPAALSLATCRAPALIIVCRDKYCAVADQQGTAILTAGMAREQVLQQAEITLFASVLIISVLPAHSPLRRSVRL